MKILAILATALLITACGGGGGGGGGTYFPVGPSVPVVETPVEKTVCSVALIGDSIMHGGYQVSLRLPVPPAANLKLQRPNYEVQDYSYNGGNAMQYASTFLTQELNTKIVVIEFGVNDAGNGLPYEVYMRQMLDRAKALNKKIVITGIVKSAATLPRYSEYNDVAKKLADEYGAVWAGWDAESFDSSADAPDGLHPSQEYSTRLVQRLALSLDTVSPECK